MKIPYIKIPIADVSAYLAPFTVEVKGKIFQAVLDFGLYQEWADLELSDREQVGYAAVKEIVENEIKSYRKFCKEQKEKANKLWHKKQTHDEAVALPLRHNQTETKTKQETELNNIKKLNKKSESETQTPTLDLFEDFWQAYPKQRIGNKDKTRLAFKTAISRTNTPAEQIVAKAREYAQSAEVAQGFAKGAQAWLNDDRYLQTYSPYKTPLEKAREEGMRIIDEMFGGKG